MFQLTHFIFLHKIKLDYGKKLSLIFMFYHNEGDKIQQSFYFFLGLAQVLAHFESNIR